MSQYFSETPSETSTGSPNHQLPAALLVLNAGSSSLKFAFFDAKNPENPILFFGQAQGLGTGHPNWELGKSFQTNPDSFHFGFGTTPKNHEEALSHLLTYALSRFSLKAVGHRIVHGGRESTGAVRVTHAILERLEALTPLAPLHQPHNLAPIRHLLQTSPRLVQIACFDTAFHRTQPMVNRLYGIPLEWYEKGIERYGFHGLSYESILYHLEKNSPESIPKKLIIAHLGNGASLCAVEHGKSIATTMGFTPADGILMGTRSGSIDPGIVPFLIRNHGMDLDAIDKMIHRESGLLGISGISQDMRDLLGSNAPRARTAVTLFVARIVREIGSLAAAMGGVDELIFTGGIGEHSPVIRRLVAEGCAWLGAKLDHGANEANNQLIGDTRSAIVLRCIPTCEERTIARHTFRLIS
jgi:acetate kinase